MNRMFFRAAVGIRFADCVFSEPVPIGRQGVPVHSAGIYVILIHDPTWGPRQFQPVFFSEFGPSHHSSVGPADVMGWHRVAAGRGLYVAVHSVAPAEAHELPVLTRELVASYRPLCNRESAEEITSDTKRRVEVLEKKTQEQEALLRLAIAVIGQTPQTASESKKRPVGFRS
jgi:hypothetical protein